MIKVVKGRRQKKRIADFQTFAQIGVGGSGKNLIEKIDLNETKNSWEGVSRNFPNSQLKNKTFIPLFSAF